MACKAEDGEGRAVKHGHSAGAFALDSDGKLVYAGCAVKGADVHCHSCKNQVFLRKGVIREPHFAHFASQVEKCHGYSGGETVEHWKAKHMVARHLSSYKFLTCKCGECGDSMHGGVMHFSSLNVARVEVEGLIPGTMKKRVADVLVELNDGRNVAIEIYHTHAVDEDKLCECKDAGVNVIEVCSSHFQGDPVSNGQFHQKVPVTNPRTDSCSRCDLRFMARQHDMYSCIRNENLLQCLYVQLEREREQREIERRAKFDAMIEAERKRKRLQDAERETKRLRHLLLRDRQDASASDKELIASIRNRIFKGGDSGVNDGLGPLVTWTTRDGRTVTVCGK